MKTKKNGIIFKSLIITVILLMVPMIVTANGNSERTYTEVLEKEFADITEGIEAGELNRVEALERLHAVRTDYGRENNADYQAMEGILLKVQAHEMTALQAKEQVRLLAECQEENSGIKLQEKVQDKNQVKTQNTTQTATKTSPAASGGGGSTETSAGASTNKAKGKK